MNILDMTLGAITDADEKGFPYRVNLHCIMNDALQVPEAIRKQFPKQIMFILDSSLHQNSFYDYDSRTFTFQTSFGGVPATVVVPAQNIGAFHNEYDGTILTVGKLQEPEADTKQPEAPTPPPPKKKERSHLSVVK